jgi:hypothetical protein
LCLYQEKPPFFIRVFLEMKLFDRNEDVLPRTARLRDKITYSAFYARLLFCTASPNSRNWAKVASTRGRNSLACHHNRGNKEISGVKYSPWQETSLETRPPWATIMIQTFIHRAASKVRPLRPSKVQTLMQYSSTGGQPQQIAATSSYDNRRPSRSHSQQHPTLQGVDNPTMNRSLSSIRSPVPGQAQAFDGYGAGQTGEGKQIPATGRLMMTISSASGPTICPAH